MKKIIATIILIGCTALGYAETVSQKQAQQLAQLFFNEASGRVTAPPKLVYNGKRLTTNRLFTPFYVYNSNNGAFVIISAENKTYPILGFSLKEAFNPDDLGETETELLRSYAREIEYIRYNSEPVEKAMYAWTHYPEYVSGILKSTYNATDPRIDIREAENLIDDAIEKDDAVYSDIYTPQQWNDMMLDELKAKSEVAIGIIGEKEIYPAVIYGHQGEYFRIEMTKRNDWLMRLNISETIGANMVSVVRNPIALPWEDEELLSFEEHDSFIAEVISTEDNRRSVSSIDIIGSTDSPIVYSSGSGHFDIEMPEEVVMANIYNIAGSLVGRHTYKETQRAHIDISSEPTGFYIVTLNGVSGKPYGLKLYR